MATNRNYFGFNSTKIKFFNAVNPNCIKKVLPNTASFLSIRSFSKNEFKYDKKKSIFSYKDRIHL